MIKLLYFYFLVLSVIVGTIVFSGLTVEEACFKPVLTKEVR